MCGIAGVFAFNSNKLPLIENVKKMSDAIAHRGPDGSGIWTDSSKQIVLAHRRLSIIDLSEEASQPMISSNGDYVIVFNGEIYNFKELKVQLVSQGVVFKSQSDTEVLLQLYINYGKDCLKLLDGMFAFAIWDDKKQEMFCARDRFGEKPFFYNIEDGCFIFGSEIKSIKAYKSELPLDVDLLQKYLSTDYSFDDVQTPFKGVVQLNPAHYLIVSKSGLTKEQYWRIDLEKKIRLENESEYFLEFKKLFTESLTRRLRSDVPVGCSLSGGLDSSTVASVISENSTADFETFSARFKGQKDEGKWIDEVVKSKKIKNNQIWPDEFGLISNIDKLTWHHEFPVASASVFAQWAVMSLPSSLNVKVLLDGQGADEYLCGYDELKYYAIWNLFHKGNFAAFIHEKKLFKANYGEHGNLGYAYLLDPILKLVGVKREVYKNGYSIKEQLRYYTSNKLGELLRIADRNSMAHSLEIRLPFLYHELVEFVFAIPDSFVYREGKTKFILREAMKNVLPQGIYNRTDKIGFAPPQNDWIESAVFLKEYNLSLQKLDAVGLKYGNNMFRNFAVSSFVNVFSK
jgi:asparagine synthase (glutamine-hydrolysing)